MSKQRNAIEGWCADIILGPGGLHDFERREMATANCDRDVAVAAWVVRCLGNDASAATRAVVDAIVERREAGAK